MNNEHPGAWQNTICFMGDDGNQNMHMADAESIVNIVNNNFSSYNIKKVYWDAYTRVSTSTGNGYPDVVRMLKQQMNDGALIMNYTGHGSAYCISHEKVLWRSDFEKNVTNHLPLWVTASCDIMPFDGMDENIGETAMHNKNGGAIAFFGTTRTVYTNQNRVINRAFMKYVLGTDENGKRISIGEAVRLAKNEMVDLASDLTENKLQYSLLGDPAMVLAAPTITAKIDSINGQHVSAGTRHLMAGQEVTVSGHIPGYESFNGVMTASVRDVEEQIVCKMNNLSETDTSLIFKDRPSTIYTGSDSVRNGRFSFTFAVPKDIRYSDSEGLILVYAVSNDKTMEAHGEQSGFVMGSTKEDANDGIGKGLSGGKIIVVPDEKSAFKADENIIVGNVALYGATRGTAYVCGIAGERFMIRNSGATGVCEGTGDHGLEYMTGGRAVILGEVGKNFAAGMSGGIAYVLDEHHTLYTKINKALVEMSEISEDADKNELRQILQDYEQATGSSKAKAILQDFDKYVESFKKIIPTDYRHMLTLIAKYEEQGIQHEQAVYEAFKESTKVGA
jgi:hypothetical protein